MVREANMKQAASEKQLKEARGKVGPPSLAGADLCFPSRTPAGLVQPLRVGKPGTGRVGPGCWRWPLTLSFPLHAEAFLGPFRASEDPPGRVGRSR